MHPFEQSARFALHAGEFSAFTRSNYLVCRYRILCRPSDAWAMEKLATLLLDSDKQPFGKAWASASSAGFAIAKVERMNRWGQALRVRAKKAQDPYYAVAEAWHACVELLPSFLEAKPPDLFKQRQAAIEKLQQAAKDHPPMRLPLNFWLDFSELTQ